MENPEKQLENLLHESGVDIWERMKETQENMPIFCFFFFFKSNTFHNIFSSFMNEHIKRQLIKLLTHFKNLKNQQINTVC